MKCKLCKGPCEKLGTLGNLAHYRCQNCGIMFNRRIKVKTWWGK